jgi:hypothetical protein
MAPVSLSYLKRALKHEKIDAGLVKVMRAKGMQIHDNTLQEYRRLLAEQESVSEKLQDMMLLPYKRESHASASRTTQH